MKIQQVKGLKIYISKQLPDNGGAAALGTTARTTALLWYGQAQNSMGTQIVPLCLGYFYSVTVPQNAMGAQISALKLSRD